MNLEDLKKGSTEVGDCGSPMGQTPSWMDFNKFFRGQDFIKKHLFSVFFSLHCSLTSGFSVINLLVPLVYTNQSHTPALAFKRYLATLNHVYSWFTGENIWDPKSKSHQSIKRVRGMHNHVAKAMKKDFPDKIYVSQYDMALVQAGFMAAVTMYPDGFGIRCTKTELEDFIFFWRGLGYLLGISDQYNMCSGNYEETYNVCKEIERKILLPSLANPPRDFRMMADAYSEGMSTPFQVKFFTTASTLACIYDGMGLKNPETLGWMDWFRYMRYKLIIWLLLWCPGFHKFMSWSFRSNFEKQKMSYMSDTER